MEIHNRALIVAEARGLSGHLLVPYDAFDARALESHVRAGAVQHCRGDGQVGAGNVLRAGAPALPPKARRTAAMVSSSSSSLRLARGSCDGGHQRPGLDQQGNCLFRMGRLEIANRLREDLAHRSAAGQAVPGGIDAVEEVARPTAGRPAGQSECGKAPAAASRRCPGCDACCGSTPPVLRKNTRGLG